jgi:hypothetical protein
VGTTDEQAFDLHPSERARAFRELVPTPQAGSIEEADALAEIDLRRYEETNPPSRRRQRRRMRAHWSDREHALGS